MIAGLATVQLLQNLIQLKVDAFIHWCDQQLCVGIIFTSNFTTPDLSQVNLPGCQKYVIVQTFYPNKSVSDIAVLALVDHSKILYNNYC